MSPAMPSTSAPAVPLAGAAFDRGERLLDRGAWPEAEKEFEAGLRLAPDDRRGALGLAAARLGAGAAADAISRCDALLAVDPDDLAAWRLRARAYENLANPGELLYSLTAVVRLAPDDWRARLQQSEMHELLGETEAAQAALEGALRDAPKEELTAERYLRLGDLARAHAATAVAERAYDRAAELDPGRSAEIAAKRVRLLIDGGRPDLALERLESADVAVPEPARALLRADVLAKIERAAEAKEVYERLVAEFPDSEEAVVGFSRLLLDEGEAPRARELLSTTLARTGKTERLVLLLAEADAAVGELACAASDLKRGVEALPRSGALWARLGEVEIALERWNDAQEALRHAVDLAPGRSEPLLRSGFVAERRGDPARALEFYDKAVALAPHDAATWCRRGLALLLVHRSEEAVASFDRALELDPHSLAAKDGKKAAGQRRRDEAVGRHGVAALRLEAELGRPVTKNELFVRLRVPFELLDPVLAAIARVPKLDVFKLPDAELADLERLSQQVVAAAFERDPRSASEGSLGLPTVAALAPAGAELAEVQRLFAYLDAVVRLEIPPENLRLTPEVEELAREAMARGDDARSLFELSRDLKVGLFRARLVRAVERAGAGAHAPLPSLVVPVGGAPELAPASAEAHFFPSEEAVPTPAVALPTAPRKAAAVPTPSSSAKGSRGRDPARCLGCGGLGSISHICGAILCAHCADHYRLCPKCQFPVDGTNALLPSTLHRRPAAPPPPSSRPTLPEAPKPEHGPASPPRARAPAKEERAKPDKDREDGPAAGRPELPSRTGPSKPSARAEPAGAEPPKEAVPPPRPRRERKDDEPRL